jgi:hypothetical protein
MDEPQHGSLALGILVRLFVELSAMFLGWAFVCGLGYRRAA